MNEQPGVNPGTPATIVTVGQSAADPAPLGWPVSSPVANTALAANAVPAANTSLAANTAPAAGPSPTAEPPASPAAAATNDEPPPTRIARPYPPVTHGWGAPMSVLAIFGICLAGGGALIGYALALALGDDTTARQYSLIWLLLGAGLVAAGWAIRARRWWGTAATIAAAIDGLVAGMYGFYGLLVISTMGGTGTLSGVPGWSISIGLVAVGTSAIVVFGLLATAWPWLTAPHARRGA